MKKRSISLWLGFLVLFTFSGGCLTQPPPVTRVHLAGFPDAQAVVPRGGPWSGTGRAFRVHGKLLCLGITIDADYCQYCTFLLNSNHISAFKRVLNLNNIFYSEGDKSGGYITRPDRVHVNFAVENAQGETKDIGFVYMLPESSRWPDRAPGFKQLGHDEQTERCVETVTDDLRKIAQELVQKLKEQQSSAVAK